MYKGDIVEIFRGLWNLYGTSKEVNEYVKITDNEALIDEFFFVILGGFGISYELNKSGLKVMKNQGYINRALYTENMFKETVYFIQKEFSKKQFEPKTNNNEFRKYRFIESKPALIASAGNWLLKECRWDLNMLLNDNEINVRKVLCSCPGIGMKSASWFLRNTGYNYNYAVLDIHILRFISRIGIDVPEVITEKGYIHLEEKLRDICDAINVPLGEMDYLLWILGRSGYLDYVGVN